MKRGRKKGLWEKEKNDDEKPIKVKNRKKEIRERNRQKRRREKKRERNEKEKEKLRGIDQLRGRFN